MNILFSTWQKVYNACGVVSESYLRLCWWKCWVCKKMMAWWRTLCVPAHSQSSLFFSGLTPTTGFPMPVEMFPLERGKIAYWGYVRHVLHTIARQSLFGAATIRTLKFREEMFQTSRDQCKWSWNQQVLICCTNYGRRKAYHRSAVGIEHCHHRNCHRPHGNYHHHHKHWFRVT